ncbi:tubulin polyglutamylase complex subunit 2 [Thraustotheca clavata]|uniref:Tubulin polyglutamylase complex subunit 2 n=1 Tax=Thraustotheca clavata TaxID=74557 RepID=A0A1V9Z1Z8_9STRA|nr:tubulin polyglutamylase complex subunit 2 [Thraustotheca clavata]
MEDLNAMSLQVFQYLATHSAVANIEPKVSPGIALHNIAIWEQRNTKTLPKDLTVFLIASNGLSVKWHGILQSKSFYLGHFAINSLQNMKKITANFSNKVYDAYVIDSSSTTGDTCMVYMDEDSVEIWLKNCMDEWHFLAKSFSNYYRLMIVHLGLIGWQQLFTPNGLDPITRQWYYLFIPGRMIQSKAADSPEKVPVLTFTL